MNHKPEIQRQLHIVQKLYFVSKNLGFAPCKDQNKEIFVRRYFYAGQNLNEGDAPCRHGVLNPGSSAFWYVKGAEIWETRRVFCRVIWRVSNKEIQIIIETIWQLRRLKNQLNKKNCETCAVHIPIPGT